MLFVYYMLIFLFLTLSAFLAFLILIQESKSMGLGASFGGDAGNSLFGTSTPQVLKKITAYLIGAFFILCLVLSFWADAISPAKTATPVMIEASSL